MDEIVYSEKTAYERLLDLFVFIAVFVVTIFLLLSILGEYPNSGIDIDAVNSIYFYINFVVLAIFFLDLVRLFKHSAGWEDFFANNWLDVLATIPFGLIAQGIVTFEILKLARLSRIIKVARISRLSRISKIGKQFKAAAHLKRESEKYKKKNRL